MANVPDPRRPREDDARSLAFFDAMTKLAADADLRDELSAACGHVEMPNDSGQVSHWAQWKPEGQNAADAVRCVLMRRGLPLELTGWAVTLGVCGTANPAAAYEYYGSRVAPSYAIENEPFTGQRQIVLRVPADWSARRGNDWLLRTLAHLQRSAIRGVPLVTPSRGGAPPKLTRGEAVALVRRFDRQMWQEWAKLSPPRIDGMGHDDWIAAFQSWLKAVGQRHSAEHVMKTHVRAAVHEGDLKLRTLDIALRARRRRSKLRPPA